MTGEELNRIAEKNIKKEYKKETASILKAGFYAVCVTVYVFMCIFLEYYLYNVGIGDFALTSLFVLMIAIAYIPIRIAVKDEDGFRAYQKFIFSLLNMICTYIYAVFIYLLVFKNDFPAEEIAKELEVSNVFVLYLLTFICILLVFILHSAIWQPFENIVRKHRANVKAEKERIIREEILPMAGNEELKKEILAQYPRYLKYVDKQTEELCRIAVGKDVLAITEIKDDDMKSKFCTFR